jgi:3-dehydroquinate synthase
VIELRCAPADGRPTLVRIGAGLLADGVPAAVAERLPGRRTSIVADRRIAEDAGCGQSELLLDAGEDLKTFDGLERILRHLVRAGLDRRSALIAVGGGSLGDAVGLAAAILLRGVELVLVPTTLLAMVDSSVGGKTAINLPEGKNLVGAYWPASEVWIDTAFLGSLPDPEWRSGLGEVLKVAVGLDAELFDHCEQHTDRLLSREPEATARAIALALAAKIRVVEEDPLENGARRLLNLGHTLGHALEMASDFSIPHGVAVARGLHHALDVADAQGTAASAETQRMRDLLAAFGFARDPLPDRATLAGFLERDKKIIDGRLLAVLPTGIGRSNVIGMAPAEFLTPR